MRLHYKTLPILIVLALLICGCGGSKKLRNKIDLKESNRHKIAKESSLYGLNIGDPIGGKVGAATIKEMTDLKTEIEAIEGTEAKLINSGEALMITITSSKIFSTNSSSLKEDSKSILNSLVYTLLKVRDKEIAICVHTDSTGEDEKNIALTSLRAKTLRTELTQSEENYNSITSQGLGSSFPIMESNTQEGRKRNNRVEILIFSDRYAVTKR